MSDVATFGGQCGTWGTVCNLWSECISEVIDIIGGGARDPQYWGDPPFYEELDKYQQKYPNKKEILIKIYIKCVNKKYNKTIVVPEKKVKITVQDVEFIVNTLNEVGVDVTNIRKYKDGDINRLLS
jgi:hypothetical protein